MKQRIYALALVSVFGLVMAFNMLSGSATQSTAQASTNNDAGSSDFKQAFAAINQRGASADSPVIGFMKLAGVPGDGTAPGHSGEIEILSFQQGITTSGGAAGAGVPGKPSLDEIKFLHPIDSSSVKLMALAANGKHQPSVKFSFQRGGQEFYTVTLADVVVSQVKQTLGTDPATINQAGMVEEVGLTFKKIEWAYFPPGQPGAPITGSYDVLTNTTKG